MLSHWGLGFQHNISRDVGETHAQSTQVKFTWNSPSFFSWLLNTTLPLVFTRTPAHFHYLLGPKGTRIVNPDILKCILGCQARTGEREHIVVHTLQTPGLFLFFLSFFFFFFFLFYSFGQDTFSMWDLSSTTRSGIKPPEVEVWSVNH